MMQVAVGVVSSQFREPFPPVLGDLIAPVGGVKLANMQREADVAKSQRRGLVGVPGHHGGSGPIVGHPRRQLIDAVAPGRIAHHVDPVGIDVLERHEVLNQPRKQPVDVALVPHVPGVGGRARRHVNAFLRTVQPLLILPLAVVDGRRRSASAMQRDEQSPSALGLLAKHPIVEFQLVTADLNPLLLQLRRPLFRTAAR